MLYDVYLYKWCLLCTRVAQEVVDILRAEFPGLIALEHQGE